MFYAQTEVDEKFDEIYEIRDQWKPLFSSVS